MRPLGVIGPLSRDVVAGGPPQIGGGPWHAARALHALRQPAIVFAKCGDADRREYQQRLASLGLPVSLRTGGETTAFAFSYDESGVRTMRVDSIGEPWQRADVAEALLRRVDWLHVAPLLRGDLDVELLAWLGREHRILLDAQGLVRPRATGELTLDAGFDRAILQHVRVLKLAEDEAAVVGDVRALGVPEVLVTAGPRGSRVITREGETHVAARPLPGDPTGAGDAFSVTYVAARAEGHRPVSAARRATALVAALMSGRAQ